MTPVAGNKVVGVGRLRTFEEAIVVGVSGGRHDIDWNDTKSDCGQEIRNIFCISGVAMKNRSGQYFLVLSEHSGRDTGKNMGVHDQANELACVPELLKTAEKRMLVSKTTRITLVIGLGLIAFVAHSVQR